MVTRYHDLVPSLRQAGGFVDVPADYSRLPRGHPVDLTKEDVLEAMVELVTSADLGPTLWKSLEVIGRTNISEDIQDGIRDMLEDQTMTALERDIKGVATSALRVVVAARPEVDITDVLLGQQDPEKSLLEYTIERMLHENVAAALKEELDAHVTASVTARGWAIRESGGEARLEEGGPPADTEDERADLLASFTFVFQSIIMDWLEQVVSGAYAAVSPEIVLARATREAHRRLERLIREHGRRVPVDRWYMSMGQPVLDMGSRMPS